MVIVLRVKKGAEVGSEFSFDQGEVRLGRTADNDVVVKDGAASRSHARVLLKNGDYLLEDLGSANGTKLNGTPVAGVLKIKPNDSIEIGDTVYVFAVEQEDEDAAAGPQSTLNEEEGDEDDARSTGEDEPQGDPNSTMIRPLRRPSKSQAMVRRPAAPRPADSVDDDEASEPPVQATGRYDISAPKAMAAAGRTGGRIAGRAPVGAQLSAAERQREKRQLEQSFGGRLVLSWRSMSRPVQLIVGLLGGMALLGLFALAVKIIVPTPTGPKRIEPESLTVNAEGLADHFGVADKIDFRKVDQKTFNFELASATRMVGVLHFHSANLSQNEVSVNFNGNDMGFAPGDVVDTDGRENDIVLPVGMMKPQANNVIIFDNVFNPPREDPWEIWDVWVEAIPVPELSAEETSSRAKDLTDTAAKLYETRALGPANMFRAWKTYREAWLLLESAPQRPEALLNLARTRMREIRPELDLLCQKISVKVRQSIQLGRGRDAENELKNVPSAFPTREHPCHMKAKRALADVGEDLAVQENR